MEAIRYQQSAEFSGETFILDKKQLVVVERSMGMNKRNVIGLTEISSDCEREERRFSRFYMVPLVFVGLAVAATWELTRHNTISPIIAICPATLVLVFLWHVGKGLKPIEVCLFRDKKGAILFEIYRPRKSAMAHDKFVSVLCTYINQAEQSREAEPKSPGRPDGETS